MTIWSVWGEISGVMAVLCLITALAAVTAAAILLIREKMTGRLWSAMKSGLRKGAGKVRKLFANETNIAEISRKNSLTVKKVILLLAAAGVWILVIGRSVSAAETVQGAEIASTAETASEAEPASAVETVPEVEIVSEAEVPASGRTDSAAENAGATGSAMGATNSATGATESATGATTAAPAEEEEPVEEPPADETAPLINIQMTEETNEDEEGLAYCRADNAGIRVRFVDDRENDSGIVSYSVVMEDSEGVQIRRESNAGSAPDNEEENDDEEETSDGGGTGDGEGTGSGEESSNGEETGGAPEGTETPIAEASIGVVIEPEETAALADGTIRVTAQATDAAGNTGEEEFTFVLDTTPPALVQIRTSSCAGDQETELRSVVLYDGTDLFYNDERQITRVKIVDNSPIHWSIQYFFLRGADESAAGGAACRQITGQGTEGSVSIAEEGVYSDWLICGEDLAGNKLVVSPKCACTQDAEVYEQTEGGIALKRRRILDRTAPVMEQEISLPAGNTAGIDARSGIVYYGSDPEQYEGGVPVITVSFRVTDQNIDAARLSLRTAYAEVPAGECCEQVQPEWKDSVPEKGKVSCQSGEEGLPDEVLLTIQKHPGKKDTPDGVYRFGIMGTDKAGNPLVIAGADASAEKGQTEEKGQKEQPEDGRDSTGSGNELTGVLCENAEEGTFMTGRKVVDTKTPGGEILVMNSEDEVYCRMEAHDRGWTSERKSPYRSETDAVIAYGTEDISPVSVSCRILSTAGEENDEAPDAETFTGGCGGRILIRGGQIFRIGSWSLRDRAGNRSVGMPGTVNFYLDTGMPYADVDVPYTEVRAVQEITARSADGRGLYGGPVTLQVLARDPDRVHGGSGLQEVWYSVRIDGETVMEEVLFRGEDEKEAVYEYSGEDGKEPVYEYRGGITIPASGRWESNDIEVTVYAADNAGNRSDPGNGGIVRFGMDTTGPEVTVRYDNNEVRNERYFGGVRTAVIAVRERNFDKGKLKVEAPGAVAGEWKRRSGAGAAEGSDVWTMEVRFAADGEYTLEVSGTDALGNPAAVGYAGAAPQAFTIDRTPPLIEVLWDNSDARNGIYYNRPRCATVRVTDLSFDENYIRILPFSRPFSKVSEVRDSRTAGVIPVYEAEVVFTEEGEWALSCACADLAGNTAAPVYEEAFVIDMTAPRLYFDRDTVQEMGAYGTEVSPELLCEDQNIAPGSIWAVWYNLTGSGCAMERGKAASEGGAEGREGAAEGTNAAAAGGKGAVRLPDLPQERAADGICMLCGTACDLAGNRAFVRRNLCVNRFGSLYDVSEDPETMEMISSFYTEAAEPFVIAEYNVSEVVSRQITLYRNGNAQTLEEGADYSVKEERLSSGMKYICSIDPAAFCEEGRYSLLVESEDEAGNYSRSTGRFRAGTEYSPSWAVDRTCPSVRIIEPDGERNRFTTDSVTVRLVPSDNMELQRLTAKITDEDGNIVEQHVFEQEELLAIMERSGGEVPITVRASSKWQTLSAEAVDGAGNSSGEGDEYRVLVTSNLMVHLYKSGILPAIAFLALILAIRFGYSVYKHTLA